MKADFLRSRTVRNVFWLFGGQFVRRVLVFLVGILSARYLGPDNFGLINYCAAYLTFFASLCTLGIDSVILKVLEDNPGEAGQTLGTTLVLRGISSLLSAGAIVGIVAIADRGEPLTVAVAALTGVSLLFQIFESLNEWFQWRLQSRFSAVATVAAYIAVSAYKIALLVTGKSVVWFALSNAVEYCVLAACLMLAYRKNGGPRFSFSMKKARELLGRSSGFILSGLMVSVYASTDKLMLKQMLSDAAVGHYALATGISTMWCFLLLAIINSMAPGIVRLFAADREAYLRRNRQLYAIVFYLCVAASGAICLLAEPIVRILYGESYLGAVAPLRIVVWYTAFSYLGVARNTWMVCENRQKYLKYLYLAAAAVNVGLNLLLIPAFGGAGAAAASLVTQTVTVLVMPALIRPLRPNARLMLQAIALKGVLPSRNRIHNEEGTES